MKFAKIFLAGLLISFIGSLPLGTLNVAAFKLSIGAGEKTAIWFALGCVMIEVIYVRLSLVAMKWVTRNQKIFKAMGIFALLLTITLAVLSFAAASAGTRNYNSVFFTAARNPFFLGILMSAVNPAQLPFWFGFSALLYAKKILLPFNNYYNWYIIGIAIGSLMASGLFIFGGQYVVRNLGVNQFILNIIIGSCFSIAALFQLWRLSVKKRVI